MADEVFLPADWANVPSGPKHWTADSRSDDPAARVVHEPTGAGPGDGKTFHFLFGYKTASEQDRSMLAEELAHIDDDVAVLRGAGFTVVVDRQATRQDLLDAVAADGTAGFYWSSHGGADGRLQCCDGALVSPADIDPATVTPGLRLAVLGACYVGAYAPAWRTAFGGHPLVAGWGRPVTLERAVDFLEAGQDPDVGLDDLIARWLLTDAPLPPDPAVAGLPPAAVTGGRAKGIARRIRGFTGHLGATWEKHDSHYAVTVPLPAGRTHEVVVFVVDGAEPFSEGVELCGMEARVGPTSALVTPERLLAGSARPGYGRIALVAGETGVPEIVTQSFTPLAGTSSQQLAAHCYQVALHADALEFEIFGTDGD
ncbi:caspase family protein [Actinoplanes awajinensis]|uniref:Uncharacterized protein n=1 Tax=Actinoplanes awajinensis subsp. mycoplanecinus TaxID=135947 RepID=A0A101JES4_9ACTN|nr:caspase family protein [Actinoplanes awajinensis]KUL25505.1 hypothetical protein ADL15_40585 [Actinoplanes awajinensis subsp. mycoplanecinus]